MKPQALVGQGDGRGVGIQRCWDANLPMRVWCGTTRLWWFSSSFFLLSRELKTYE